MLPNNDPPERPSDDPTARARGAPRSSRWRARLVRAVAATAVTLVVVALVGEWAVRYRERHRTTVPGTMSKLFYRHDRLGQALVRGSDYFGWVYVGPEGFRGVRSVLTVAPDSVIRIIAAGGSATFDGNTSGDSSSWPARLEQVLNASGSGVRYEVLNAGVPGQGVFDDLVRLELELYAYHPDIIVLYQGHNDVFNALARAGAQPSAEFDARPSEVQTVFPWQQWLERHSLLYHKLGSLSGVLRFNARGSAVRAQAGPANYQAALSDGVAAYGRNLRLYVAAARALGIQVVIPQMVYAARSPQRADADSHLVALWNRGFPFASERLVWEGFARFDSAARATAATAGALYVPAADSALWSLECFAAGDPVHFSDRGALRWAQHLARAIAQHGVRRTRQP